MLNKSAITLLLVFSASLITSTHEYVTISLASGQSTQAILPSPTTSVPSIPEVQVIRLTSASSEPTSLPAVPILGSANSSFETQMLDCQNWYRNEHAAPNLHWNESLAMSSKAWADKCPWKYSDDEGVGENMAATFTDVASIVDSWGLERTKYNWLLANYTATAAQFTQMVWKATTDVGCAYAECPSPFATNDLPTTYIVCQYYPPGNVGDEAQWSANVGPLQFGSLGTGIVASGGIDEDSGSTSSLSTPLESKTSSVAGVKSSPTSTTNTSTSTSVSDTQSTPTGTSNTSAPTSMASRTIENNFIGLFIAMGSSLVLLKLDV